MTYKIKEVFPTRDAQAFVDIVKMDAELFPNSGRHLPSSGYWWIAYNEKNKPVAFAGMTKSKQKHHGEGWCAVLVRAAVKKVARGNGLQRRLIFARLAKARELGLEISVVYTNRNPWSENNLIACGFLPYAPVRKWADGYNMNYWRRYKHPPGRTAVS